MREAKRNNSVYRPHALKCLGEFAKDREDLDLMPDAMKIVFQVVEDLVDDTKDKMEVDAADVRASK